MIQRRKAAPTCGRYKVEGLFCHCRDSAGHTGSLTTRRDVRHTVLILQQIQSAYSMTIRERSDSPSCSQDRGLARSNKPVSWLILLTSLANQMLTDAHTEQQGHTCGLTDEIEEQRVRHRVASTHSIILTRSNKRVSWLILLTSLAQIHIRRRRGHTQFTPDRGPL